MATWADFKKEIKVSEGSISHMYLDTVGKVTVGVGNMLPNFTAAQKHVFVVRATPAKKATKAQIKTDFETVKKQTKGLKASSYKKHTLLNLPTTAIDKLLDTRISGFKKELKVKFPKFASYPLTVQFALTDMAFNLGTNGVVTKFPTFTKAIKAEDWKKAAAQSNRPQVSKSRNATVKKWLLDAAK